MNKVLVIAILALVYLDAAGSLKCNYCRNVRPGNVCKHVEKTCQAGKRKFCYSRMTVKGGHIKRVERGCSRVCISTKYRNVHRMAKYMLCCDEDYCNNHKLWNEENSGKLAEALKCNVCLDYRAGKPCLKGKGVCTARPGEQCVYTRIISREKNSATRGCKKTSENCNKTIKKAGTITITTCCSYPDFCMYQIKKPGK
nr:prostate and testis expressed protein 1 [Pogona vitticeps]